MKMPTAIGNVQVVFLLVCIFKPGGGQLTLTSSEFTCGQPASIVCSGIVSSLERVTWFKNDVELLICTTTICQPPFPPNYKFSADGGVWTLIIDPVELKYNNIRIGCQTANQFSTRVSSTIDVSVPIDNSSSLVETENATDVVLKAVTNCVKPVVNINIKWQCVKADQVHVLDSDCRLTSLPAYTSECKGLNQTCAGPGTFRMGKDMKMPAYRGNYFKLVKIKVVFTDGSKVIEKISAEINQELPPKITPLKDCNVIENTDFSVNCNLSSGDPSTVKCTWTAPSGMISNDCNLRIPSIQRTSSGTHTCRAENSVGTDTKSFYLDILYAPSVHTMRHQRIIEGSNFSQICDTTPGRPTKTYYLWTRRNGWLSVNKRDLTITNVAPGHADNYTCTAWNILKPSYGNTSNGTDQMTFSLEILYPPKLKAIPNQSVIEGSSFTQNCEFLRHGNPPGKIMWFSLDQARNEMPIRSVNGSLTFAKVSRNQQGLFKCVTENLMDPTDREKVKGTDFKIFHLNVFYTTSISSLTIDGTAEELVVNQNSADVQIVCNISSNPFSEIVLQSKTHSGSRTLQEKQYSDHLLYSLSTATCWDSGVYTCSGRNNITENGVSKAVTLLVECTARPLHETEQNVTFYKGVGDDITLSLTLVSYPLPASELFQWTRVHKKQITRFNGSTVNLSNSSLESSLILKDIQEGNFGQYKLTIKYNNTMDAFVQYFFINAQDKPQVPKHFVHLEEEITPTTAFLKWTPGFNGGIRQEFNILYKKASDSTWSHIVVSNSTLTLTGLDPSTLYNVYVFASNELGNSSRTVTLNVTTKPAIEESQSPKNAAIIGGAAGAATVILLAVAVVLLVVFIRRLEANKSRQSADSQRRKVDAHDLHDPTTGTHGHSGTNEYYNTSRDTYDELQTCSSSGPYEDLNPSLTTEHAYGTLNRNNDEKTPALPTSSTYENLRLTPFK